ncbi:MAG TPA: hypothetical protein VFE64_07215 [Devosia sp.]|nr:hypothetical protein [Devosia sp.]
MTRVLLAAAAMFMASLATGSACANDRIGDFVVYSQASDIIALDGEIDAGTIRDFHRALKARPNTRVILLESPGGYVDEALSLAAEIRRLGLSTAIPKTFGCYSACSYLFFAGKEHVVRGELGVHAVAEEGGKPGQPVYDGDVRMALKRYGAPASVIKAMASTPSSDMHVFSAKEISAYALNRAAAGSKTTLYASR